MKRAPEPKDGRLTVTVPTSYGKPFRYTVGKESDQCPICGALNLCHWAGMALAKRYVTTLDVCQTTKTLYHVGPFIFAIGSACWDAPYGDTCGACERTVLNTRLAMIGPDGMGH